MQMLCLLPLLKIGLMKWQLLAALLFVTGASWAGPIVVNSPDGALRFVFRLAKDGDPEYDVLYRGVGLVEHSPLGLGFLGSGVFGPGLLRPRAVITEGTDVYALVVGKTSAVSDRYKQAVIRLEEPSGKAGPVENGSGRGRKIDFVVKVFNDGLAFRWVIPKQAGWELDDVGR